MGGTMTGDILGYATLKKMGVEKKGVREWHYSGLLTSTQNGTRLVLLKNPRLSFVVTKISQ